MRTFVLFLVLLFWSGCSSHEKERKILDRFSLHIASGEREVRMPPVR